MKTLKLSLCLFAFVGLALFSCQKKQIEHPGSVPALKTTSESTIFIQNISISQIAILCNPHKRSPTGFCWTFSQEEYATIQIFDQNNKPVSNAAVSGNWSGCLTGTETALTNINGYVQFKGKKCAKNCTLTFTVNNVVLSGSTYDPGKNITTSATKVCN